MHRLIYSLLVALAVGCFLPACCCDSGPPRLSRVEVDDDYGFSEGVSFGSSLNSFPVDGFFTVFRVGEPGPGRLRTVPLLELYDAAGQQLELQRFTAINDGGCAKAEIYEPYEGDLVIGDSYRLVHRASASPGDLGDSGQEQGDLEELIEMFEGEPALVAELLVTAPHPSTGQGGAGNAGGFTP